MYSPWRTLLYKELESVALDGSVVDLGGSKNASYHKLLKGNHSIQSVNIDEKNGYDLSFDLEEKFPVHDASYNAALCINVLEHIFNYNNLLKETYRILKTKGVFVLAVPFLVPYHPSPNDYWRYTEDTLQKIVTQAGFKNIVIKPVGRGPFTAAANIQHNVLKFSFIRACVDFCAGMTDDFFNVVLSNRYGRKQYPLGYLVVAEKL